MSDSSYWDTGDPFAFYYTNSTSSKSIDYLMANGVGSTAYDGAAIEIEGQPAGVVPNVSVGGKATLGGGAVIR